MSHTLLKDRRVNDLLTRVREDVSHLREDIGNLVSHTTHSTLPNGARELAEQAKSRLAAGGAYAATRLRGLRQQPPRQSAGWVGGAVVLGLLAYGAYKLYQEGCCCTRAELDDNEMDEEAEPEES